MVRFKILVNYSRLQRFGRQRTTIKVALLAFTICLCYFPWTTSFVPRTDSLACPSEVNKRNALLATRKIKVFTNDDFLINKNATDEAHAQDKYPNYEGDEELLHGSGCVAIDSLDKSQKLTICIYDPSKDLKISYHLKNFGSWEKENVGEMMKALQMFPDLTHVDLGSNLGVFTLQAARTGSEVVAVDALWSNHQLLYQSLVKNDLTCRVTLLHNALHAKRGHMRITVNPSNIGGSVVSEIPDFRKQKVPHRNIINSICLDDLVSLVRGKDVFLKMDLEGSEDAVLRCADDFFRNTNVKVLLMEWMNYRHNEKASARIKAFLVSHHMVPTWGVNRDRVIDLEASHSWPDNVFWMKL